MTKKLCLEEACENNSSSRGLCRKHYMWHRNHGTLEQFGGVIVRHCLSDIDTEAKTGTCSVCGQGQRLYLSGTQWKCIVKRRHNGALSFGDGQRLQRKVIKESYDRLVVEQSGLCACCGKPCSVNSILSVDHCHETGKIRGLLCNKCNTGMGLLGDSIEGLQAAIDYLRRAEDV